MFVNLLVHAAFVERDIEDLQRDYEKTKKATKEKIEELDELRGKSYLICTCR